ncbi:hypothetical protein JCM11641_003180 [Rhodosporidiobolus odoratus]
MSGPFATPTICAGNPLEAALAAEATPRASRSVYTAPSPLPPPRTAPPTQYPVSPPPSRPYSQHRLSSSSYARPQPRSPPSKRPHPQASPRAPHAQQTQQQPDEEALQRFAALCRRLYYERHPDAAKQVDATLGKLEPSFRSAYARTMAAVRAEFHRDDEVRRRKAVEDLLSSIVPASSVRAALAISPDSTSVSALRSSKAKQVRRDGIKAFVDANCVKAMPGAHPFFKSLFAVLWLQGLDSRKGGAGARCVEWEVDLAVFSEAGGEGWVKEAVEALKGVLGMSERITEPSCTDSTRTSYFESTVASSSRASSIAEPSASPPSNPSAPGASATSRELDSQYRPSEHGMLEHPSVPTSTTGKKQPPPVPPHRGSMRSRAKSDPFLSLEEKEAKKQAAAALTPLAAPFSPSSPKPPSPDPSSAAAESTPVLSLSPAASLGAPTSPPAPPALPLRQSTAPSPSATTAVKPQFRTFTLPNYLTNPECRTLCRLFPDFISSPTKPAARFRSNSASKAAAKVEAKLAADAGKGEEVSPKRLEEGEGKRQSLSGGGGGGGGGVGKVGHGELRIGKEERREGWKGTRWERFVGWLRELFRLA